MRLTNQIIRECHILTKFVNFIWNRYRHWRQQKVILHSAGYLEHSDRKRSKTREC